MVLYPYALSDQNYCYATVFVLFFFIYEVFISGTEHPSEDKPVSLPWNEITGRHTQTHNGSQQAFDDHGQHMTYSAYYARND